jgi:thiamine-phosphate pyrophosphorylase
VYVYVYAYVIAAPGETPVFTLYLITDGHDPSLIPRAVSEALANSPPGRIAVQLRAKACDPLTLFDLATQLRAITSQLGAALLINDRADIALATRADGVHLPERGLPIAAARALLGPHALIGASCHSAQSLARAAREGASFATLSPVFPSPDKGEPLGVTGFAALSANARLPVYALGGVLPEHAPQLRAAGAQGLAVISGVFSRPDRAAAVERFLSTWDDSG